MANNERGVSTRKSGRNNCAISECASHLIITITASFGRARTDERAVGMGVRDYLIASSHEIPHAPSDAPMIKQRGIIVNFAPR
jgi:hypothetical protein